MSRKTFKYIIQSVLAAFLAWSSVIGVAFAVPLLQSQGGIATSTQTFDPRPHAVELDAIITKNIYASTTPLNFPSTSTTTFTGGIATDALKTNLASCNTTNALTTDASGNVICGSITGAGGGGSGVPNLIYRTLSGTKYYTASSSATDNNAFHFNNGFVSSGASSTIADALNVTGKINASSTIYSSATAATSSLLGGLTVDTNTLVVNYTKNTVGIGTLAPYSNKFLTLGSGGQSPNATAQGIYVDSSGGGGIYFGDASKLAQGKYEIYAGLMGIGTMTNHPLTFWVNNGEVGRFATTTGNLGIASTTPVQKLSVAGSAYVTGGVGIGNATTTSGVLETSGLIYVGGIAKIAGTGTSTISGGLSVDALKTNLSTCSGSSALQVDSSGGIICGSVNASISATSSNQTFDVQKILTTSVIATSTNLTLDSSAYIVANKSLNASSTFHATGNASFGSNIILNGDTINDFTGSGLSVSGSALTLDRTGDWTGTFDGQEGTYYLARANHTGTQAASTITAGTFTAGDYVFPAGSTLGIYGSTTINQLNIKGKTFASSTLLSSSAINIKASSTFGSSLTVIGAINGSSTIHAAGPMTLTANATSSITGGLSVDAITTNLTSCSGSNALTTNASGAVVCGAISAGATGWSYSSPNISLTTITDSVGIGTSTPSAKLAVAGNLMLDSKWIHIGSSTAPSIILGYQGNSTSTIPNANGSFSFATSSATGQKAILSINGNGTIYSDQIATSTFSGGITTAGLKSTKGISITGGFITGDSVNPRIGLSNNNGSTISYGTTNVVVGAGIIRFQPAGTESMTMITAGSSIGVSSTSPWGQFSIEQIAGQITTHQTPLFNVSDQGTSTPHFFIDRKGNLGIGTTTQLANKNARLTIDGHVVTGGVPPTLHTGTDNCGTGATVAGNDMAGRITLGTVIASTQCQLTFNKTWARSPVCFMNDETAVLASRTIASTTGMIIRGGTNASGDVLGYYCIGY